jgi:hypothetical protein
MNNLGHYGGNFLRNFPRRFLIKAVDFSCKPRKGGGLRTYGKDDYPDKS